mmetsp:Transcript_61631/g.170844  ORF Transcript_61631/g.170844 Transcript_61631/m.170844 type:complete len:202 (-) Transcript_61631:1394-1999(-)
MVLAPCEEPHARQFGLHLFHPSLLHHCRTLSDFLPPGSDSLVAGSTETDRDDDTENDARRQEDWYPQPPQPSRAGKVKDGADDKDDESPRFPTPPVLLGLVHGCQVRTVGQGFVERTFRDEAIDDGNRPQHIAGREAVPRFVVMMLLAVIMPRAVSARCGYSSTHAVLPAIVSVSTPRVSNTIAVPVAKWTSHWQGRGVMI